MGYEEVRRRPLRVYGLLSPATANDVAYREYTGSWGPEQYLDNTNNATDLQYSVLELAPKAQSDQVGLMAGTTNGVTPPGSGAGPPLDRSPRLRRPASRPP